jgi:hypothetical protein
LLYPTLHLVFYENEISILERDRKEKLLFLDEKFKKIVFDRLVDQNKVNNKIQDHIRILRETAHRTMLRMTAFFIKLWKNRVDKTALYCVLIGQRRRMKNFVIIFFLTKVIFDMVRCAVSLGIRIWFRILLFILVSSKNAF